MNLISVMWIVLGTLLFFMIFFVLFFIAGRDIVMAFKRKFFVKGCEVYIANPNRNVSHYYQTPKENTFRIDSLLYVTNPEKTMNLSEVDKVRINFSLAERENKLKERINTLEQRKAVLIPISKTITNEEQRMIVLAEIEKINGNIALFKGKIKFRQEVYYKDKRPAFFFIEGDPIPKDFYEYYSELDSKMVDNLISRALTSNPKQDGEQDIKWIKLLLYGSIIASGIAAFMAFKSSAGVAEICKHLGLSCGV